MKICKIFFLVLFYSTIVVQETIALCVTVKTIKDADCGICNGQIDLNNTPCPNPHYLWSGPNGFSSTSQNISNLCAGDYYLTFTSDLGTEYYSWTVNENIFQNHNWAVHPAATEGNETIVDMAVDPNGDVYVIGTYLYQINFGQTVGGTNITLNNTEANTRAVFVAKWDYCGKIEAARNIAWNTVTPDSINLHLELLSGVGPVIIAGEYNVKMNITGSPVLVENAYGYDIFLGVLASSSNLSGVMQASLVSGKDDRFKGMSVDGTSFAFCGSFTGPTLTVPGTPTRYINNHNLVSVTSDYFICLYNWNGSILTLPWATNNFYTPQFMLNEHGMTMQYINPYIYYSYKAQLSNPVSSRGYLAQVNASTGVLINTAIIDPSGQGWFYEIQDMTRYNGQLYACGYRHDPATPANKQVAVLRYTTSIVTPTNWMINGGGTADNNSANKIYVDASGAYVTGTYGINGFAFGGFSLNLFGTINHFVLKTNLTLTPVYLQCMASSVGAASSKGNAISYDATKDVFYIAGTFTNTMNLHATNLGQQITATNSADAFIARFEDQGGTMEFRNLIHQGGFIASIPFVSIYPNPTKGILNISSTESIKKVVVTDLTGRSVFVEENPTDSPEHVLNMNIFPDGVYFISVTTGTQVKTEKIIVTK